MFAPKESIVEAYREATGLAWMDDNERLEKEFKKAGLRGKCIRIVRRQVPVGEMRKAERQRKGIDQLGQVIGLMPAIYPRERLTYEINLSGANFAYELIFTGETIDQEGQVRLSYNPKKVWLRRGTERSIEVERDQRRVLHLPEGEGVAIRATMNKVVSISWPVGEGVLPQVFTLATWIPDLSDKPQLFEAPSGGQLTWHTDR